MQKFTKPARTEFEIALALLAVGLLNTIVFVSLSAGKFSEKMSISKGIDLEISVYGIYLLASLISILYKKRYWLRTIFIFLLAFMTVHILSNLYSLIINPVIADNGRIILLDAMLIWLVSIIVFSMWYWIIDRGGPVAREEEDQETRYDLLFPQYQTQIKGWEKWHPKFADFLFFSFFTSTGFSPADTLPLTIRIKFLMMIEAFISLIIIGMIASRALSLIGN